MGIDWENDKESELEAIRELDPGYEEKTLKKDTDGANNEEEGNKEDKKKGKREDKKGKKGDNK